MDEEAIRKQKEAFEKMKIVLEYAKELVKPNAKILEIAEAIENKIFEVGAKPAFPVNIGINEIAAHYTPSIDDQTILKEGDMVKIDVGLHVDGYISDNAFTILVGKNSHPMIETAKKAVEEARKILRENVKISEISEVIENTVTSSGFKVVKNLTGHFLDRYVVHGVSIPNVRNEIETKIPKNQALAIEVFVTNGSGWVKEGSEIQIFQFKEDRGSRIREGKKIIEIAKSKFEGLPFAKRWLKDIPRVKLEFAIRDLLDRGCLIDYPVLKEESNSLVAQWEESFIVE
ncbi:MAG: type II methionyl aminopeptidase [Candidatus Aenigmatarchaeota archaeon]